MSTSVRAFPTFLRSFDLPEPGELRRVARVYVWGRWFVLSIATFAWLYPLNVDEVEEIRRVADLSLFAQIEPLDQMRDFLEAVFAVKLQTTSTNRLGKPGVLTTMARLSQWALENGYLDSERGKDSRKG